MRKVLLKFLSVGLALIIFSIQTKAFTTIGYTVNSTVEITSVTNFDETEIYNAFTEVNSLVNYLHENDGITLKELETSHNELVSNINKSAALAYSTTSETPPIFNAFIWGCLLNWIGMVIVGISTDFDSQQITKSGWGCLISTLLWGGGLLWF
jgi:hypothetical protein